MLTVEYQISTDTSFLFAQIRCLQSAGWCAFFHIVVYLCRRREKKIIEMASDWTKYSINSFLWNAVNFSPIFFSSPIPDPISCCIIIITHATNSVYTVCIEQFSVQSLNIKEVRAHPSLIWFRLSRAMYLCSPGCCLTAWLAKLWCWGQSYCKHHGQEMCPLLGLCCTKIYCCICSAMRPLGWGFPGAQGSAS